MCADVAACSPNSGPGRGDQWTMVVGLVVVPTSDIEEHLMGCIVDGTTPHLRSTVVKKSLITTAIASAAVALAGAGALAAASSVSTTPEPALISHLDGTAATTPNTTRHGTVKVTVPTMVDDHGVDVPATPDDLGDDHGTDVSVPSAVGVPVTVDDHGVDVPATLNDLGDDHGTDATVRGPVTTLTTVEDHRQDTPTTIPRTVSSTVDDHGHHGGGSDDALPHH
jgi:hypothetical protein